MSTTVPPGLQTLKTMTLAHPAEQVFIYTKETSYEFLNSYFINPLKCELRAP